ncbi:MAG: pyridoxamine 5'-phosphate oxidase family protein [Chloroflexi bacterium]|nr:pyridoxamine 5'-phosphate oxidase family protein [Chloroflexota bacterium]MCI0648215.1 pyridoxamine 5'-phosphate oxidase family protein [Chloroflexota bacterium]MCI0726442.1 pyridoxamine 5'-phosphate oxidase family protein [Chloroflexota bacterium]
MTRPTLFDAQAREVLQQPVIVRVSTITPAGYPHTVPVWFMLDGDDLIIFGEGSTQKVRHVRANPKGCFAIGGDPPGSPGYLIEGDFTVEEDPDHTWAGKITRHYEPPQQAEASLAEWKELDLVVLRLKVRRVIKV